MLPHPRPRFSYDVLPRAGAERILFDYCAGGVARSSTMVTCL